ncbi:MAG: hypothetical protein AW11_01742 [Candidatus Accumulibacter regalis]|uniref:Uncharacterized protein n=1 Tax=Accumulibacter regalis TaxID=522306 RepID=A0A011PP43_ACCRE|nr:MAG: hypothetical protein AW11_01742 [Candidatus Accumulibacter regalis]
MDVVLGDVRQLEVHHVRQLLDVQTARGDVGGHQHAHRAVLETGQGTRARRLALVAVDRGGLDAGFAQIFGEAVGAALHAREHQYLFPVARRHQVHQQVALAPAIDRVYPLRDELGLGVAACDFDHRRVVQQAVGELADLFREGRREEQVLAFRRQHREDAADVADEAHVQHAVGFVEHQDLDVRQFERLLLQVIEQPPGCGDQDVDATAQGVDLRVDVHAAIDQRRLQFHVLAVGAYAFLDLRRKFARRGQD